MKRLIAVAAGIVLGSMLIVPVAGAQTNAEVNAGIQFNFSTPGARSLGLGGAFLGLADDATAAYTNPAGLTTLSKPEISFEGRQWDYTNTFTDSGHGFGPPSGEGLDTVAGLQEGESSSDTTGLSFLSYVYPKNRWAFAIYRHELANFDADYRTQGAFFGEEGSVSRFFPVQARMELDIVNYGASFAYRLSDAFTLGLGVSFYELEMDSLTERFGLGAEFYGEPNYDPARVINFQTQTGDDDDTAFNVGILWDLSDAVSLGAVYRQGPEFTVAATNTAGPFASTPGQVFATFDDASFNVPDVYGLGLAFRPSDVVRIALDWNHVEYSALTQDIRNLFGTSSAAATERLTVDDADEIHAGFEYVFVNGPFPIAFRLGSWYDPAHKVYFEGDPGDDAGLQTLAALFREGDDEIHYSIGFGFILGESFQLDLAADFSDPIDTMSLSGVYRF
jgi:long-subunit fatty acid transport protein